MEFFGQGGQFDPAAWIAAGQVSITPAPGTSALTDVGGSGASETPTSGGSLPRASGAAGGVLGHKPTKEGDWECPSCQNVNFAKRTKCNKCSTAKPKTGDPLQDVPHFSGPPGLFKKGDWPCPHCGNVNWARRDKCNICNAPRPAEKEEPRTGRGGGHFDLQDPADRNRHESDDEEFDEFGRRKKRRATRHTTGASSDSASSAPIGEGGGGSSPAARSAFPPAPKFSSSRNRSRSRSRSRDRDSRVPRRRGTRSNSMSRSPSRRDSKPRGSPSISSSRRL